MMEVFNMKRVETDLSKLDELIARQYEDKIRGFAKDTLQNSWEARKNRKKGTDFAMSYEFFPTLGSMSNVLKLEDGGTVGMNEERWKAFHSHWISTKGGSYAGGIGRWGQGKTLLLYFSSINTIITESIDEKDHAYKYSIRNNIGYVELGDKPVKEDPDIFKSGENKIRTLEEFFPTITRLNHPGTRIWILSVRDELASEILEGNLKTEISESWWEIIRNYDVNIRVKVH